MLTESALRRGVIALLLVPACFFALAGCSTAPEPALDRSIRSDLATIGGTYEWNTALDRYVFSDKPGIARLVEPGTDQSIRELVECLDDGRPSRTMLAGSPVPVGVVCYEALGQLVYYEPTTSDGDIASEWAGYIDPAATAEDLRAAKRAWTEVIENRSYHRL